MFFPALGVNEMKGFLTSVETILDERAEHAMLLVDTVEERTNMAILVESTPGILRRLRGGLHILTFTQRAAVKSTGWCLRLMCNLSVFQALSAGIQSVAVTSQCWLWCPGRWRGGLGRGAEAEVWRHTSFGNP
jgi:hypothetical protein